MKEINMPSHCNPYGLRVFAYGDADNPSYSASSATGNVIATLDRCQGYDRWSLFSEQNSTVEGVAVIRAAEDIREGRGAPEVLNRTLPSVWTVFGERPGGKRVAGQRASRERPRPLHARKAANE